VIGVGLSLHIGKERNHLEEVQDGLVTDPDEVYVVYRDPRREWEAAIRPASSCSCRRSRRTPASRRSADDA
jgi:hypothetical protein